MGFDRDTALEPSAPGRWEGVIADGWSTPRGPLGGYVMAILIRALELAVDDATRQPRSVSTHFLRPPVPGPVEVKATLERAGRSLSTVSGRLEQEGKPVALAIGAYSTPWEGAELGEWPMPEVERAEPEPSRIHPDAPPFARRMLTDVLLAGFETGSSATASSRRTASCGAPTAPWSPILASSRCCSAPSSA